MPEYLAPGVYVEEVSFRSKSIEGVPTSTTGFAGVTRYGPVAYTVGDLTATASEPRLITSYTEFERVYGGLQPLNLAADPERVSYLAHAARAFFNNGGKRLYVSRVFAPAAGLAVDDHIAKLTVLTSVGTAQWRARWPGADGNVLVDTQVVRSKNLAFTYPTVVGDILARHTWGVQVKSVRHGAVIEVKRTGDADLKGNDALVAERLYVVQVDADGRQTFVDSTGAVGALPGTVEQAALVELKTTVYGPQGRVDAYDQLAAHPDQHRFISRVLDLNDPEDDNAMVWLSWDPMGDLWAPASLMVGLQAADKRLGDINNPGRGVTDGELPGADAFLGLEADPDVVTQKATGLEALGEIEDIAIVALPDAGALLDDTSIQVAAGHLIAHAEKYRYRIAVVDGPRNSSVTEIREFRGQFDSKYAALYHPWIEVLDPLVPTVPGVPPRKLLLPPSGFVTGIYARNDIERGVHKAPANEIVRGLTKFEININKARQDVLNPEGVNCLRFFEGRGNRVWGARTMSSDPEWKYVNVRRLFIYMEHSIEKATQWAVFEPNNQRLWSNIRSTIEDFLYVLWRDGALLGAKPEEAYFVRCDRSTMTQNDLDNGRMICQVGVAPSRPAEYVIFRIGQWTADAKS
ncbi:MAG TPA: phage tail sheath subtilisin-like domain-containing protein [Aquabacterium sp.]|uniref:phage tail sheath family protein n=1 Tax=Aquabacterium sp. TaxID=1872578 RepID=UPI002E33AAA7|nr:phage tail sheath subtilisin-like domain-containing protein [Aquabacterium sp.]HEX5373072.1 phage tail sheath subtilisin-like domain-containing protein [Aquabacterium sp.]